MLRRLLIGVPLLLCAHAHASDYIVYPHGIGKPGVYVPGARTYFAGEYKPSEQNGALLKELKPVLRPMRIAGFSATNPGTTSLLCRASYPVYLPGKIAFEAFVAEAMRAELTAAGLYSEDAGVPVTGHLETMDFSSFGTGKWVFEATFSVGDKAPFTVRHESTYPVSYSAVAACGEVGQALVPAIQEFLHALYDDEKFKALAQ